MRVRSFGVLLPIIFMLVTLVGCRLDQDDDSSISIQNAGTLGQTGKPVTTSAVSRISPEDLQGERPIHSTSADGGISVRGSATISVEPDVAVLNMGVEAFGKTVSSARSDAALAMESIISSLKNEGVLEKDIQTQRFNISPTYEWRETSIGPQATNKQVLTGYSVSNSARVKIRDLGDVGEIVDRVAGYGGDLVRINGISFDVEDTDKFMPALRKQAVQNALMKADEYAKAAGLNLGVLRSLSEVGSVSPYSYSPMENQMRAMSAPMESPVSGGELQISLTIFTVFDID